MRTTPAEHAADRRGRVADHDEQEFARDNPRRQREPRIEAEDGERDGNATSRSPRRHGVQ
jgi:hypothetical protein